MPTRDTNPSLLINTVFTLVKQNAGNAQATINHGESVATTRLLHNFSIFEGKIIAAIFDNSLI